MRARALTLGGLRRMSSLDLIEIIAREDSPLFRDFEPKCVVCLLGLVSCACLRCQLMLSHAFRRMLNKLLARVPEILIRMAAQEPESNISANGNRHDALCRLLLT